MLVAGILQTETDSKGTDHNAWIYRPSKCLEALDSDFTTADFQMSFSKITNHGISGNGPGNKIC